MNSEAVLSVIVGIVFIAGLFFGYTFGEIRGFRDGMKVGRRMGDK